MVSRLISRCASALHVLGRPAMFMAMRWLSMMWLLLSAVPLVAVPAVESVAILCNSADPDSVRLAETYRKARGIPAVNVIGLNMPLAEEISRAEYEEWIQAPLRKEFDHRGWWKLGKDSQGVLMAVSNRMRVLVTMRGVPLKIRQSAVAQPSTPPPDRSKDPFKGHDEAAVDSELALCGVFGMPLDGGLRNPYHQFTRRIEDANLPFFMLTSRIDAASTATCERMIRDAIESESTGLWGMAYVDIANKNPQGDGWLAQVVQQNRRAGIPTVIDRFNDTLPAMYPMRDAAMYFGWYDWNVSGPFLNPGFQFRKGAIAVHLHSYSAQQLRDPARNWSAGLLEKGAAATLGNVYEPYLHMTHDLGLLHQRLLDGFTWAEACWMSIPAASWQSVILGDPLYQPFRHIDGSGLVRDTDRAYRALRAASVEWPTELNERRIQIERAADRMQSGVLAEALGLNAMEEKQEDLARQWFLKAKAFHAAPADQLRQDFHCIAIDRAAQRKDQAIRQLREAETRYATIPEVGAVKGWLDILDPPAPPPAIPAKPAATPAGSAQPPSH